MNTPWNVESLKTYMDERFRSQELSVKDALAASDLAISKAELAVEKRLENTNEWRSAMNDRDVRLLPRAEFAAILNEWSSWRIEREEKLKLAELAIARIETRLSTWFASGAVFFTVVQLVIFWLNKK